ncbi:MAG TPA: glycosyltransferase, partial [Gemmatimonadaceae bacterium]|nr:glycosyltransferase [Gemmatimonadaceae bacterium]
MLVGNYAADRSESMNRYAEMLERVLTDSGHAVRLVIPPRVFGKLTKDATSPAKWLGYLDKYLIFPRRLNKDAAWADIVHITDQGNGSYARLLRRHVTVITCHDMFAIRAGLGTVPDHSLKYTGRVLQASNRKGLEAADAVICVSDYTKEELLRFTACDPARVRVAYNPLNYPYTPATRGEIDATLVHVGADPHDQYFLHVGGNYPYKNRPGVVRIFSELRRTAPYRDAKLVMAGARWPTELRETVAMLGLTELVLEVETPTNEALRALYSGALALIFPSFYEGFGWPLVEAQACGCPVAT